MSPGSNTVSYPAFTHIGLRENPGKNLNQVTCPDQESNPGHLVSRLDMLTDMDLIEVLWKQDVDLGFSLDLFNPSKQEGEGKALPVEEDDVEKLKALEALKNETPADPAKNEEETPDDQWAGLSYTIDLETGRPRRRWEDNIKMDLRVVRYDDRDWINLAQDRDQWQAYVGGNEPPGSLKASNWLDGWFVGRSIGRLVGWIAVSESLVLHAMLGLASSLARLRRAAPYHAVPHPDS
ncbi:hypothetical protein ANN_02226 [Periplaneta americana]|uniref:Uncharacterized protein n=1 Tax=Periplaneta americana TaxID=6978 RepID=A0ABQ8TY58_PERAM|nr:hypothetical protein ANN_02226 [Periplaneta americana]